MKLFTTFAALALAVVIGVSDGDQDKDEEGGDELHFEDVCREI